MSNIALHQVECDNGVDDARQLWIITDTEHVGLLDSLQFAEDLYKYIVPENESSPGVVYTYTPRIVR